MFYKYVKITSIGPTPKGWISKFVSTKIFEILSCLTGIDWEAETFTKWLHHWHIILPNVHLPNSNQSGVRVFQIF